MFGGAFSAIPGTVAMVPGDRIKVMLQADGQGGSKKMYSGPLDCAKKMFKADGIRSFYKVSPLKQYRCRQVFALRSYTLYPNLVVGKYCKYDQSLIVPMPIFRRELI